MFSYQFAFFKLIFYTLKFCQPNFYIKEIATQQKQRKIFKINKKIKDFRRNKKLEINKIVDNL